MKLRQNLTSSTSKLNIILLTFFFTYKTKVQNNNLWLCIKGYVLHYFLWFS